LRDVRVGRDDREVHGSQRTPRGGRLAREVPHGNRGDVGFADRRRKAGACDGDMGEPTAEWTAARAALTRVTPQFVGLLRAVQNPTARAIGDWTIGDTAAHVSVVVEADAYLAESDATPPAYLGDLVERERTATIDDVAVLNRISLERQTERDPRV